MPPMPGSEHPRREAASRRSRTRRSRTGCRPRRSCRRCPGRSRRSAAAGTSPWLPASATSSTARCEISVSTGEHQPTAEPVGQRAGGDPAHRADQDRHGDQQGLLGRRQTEFVPRSGRRAGRSGSRPRSVMAKASGGQGQVLAPPTEGGALRRLGHRGSFRSQGSRSRVPTGAQPRRGGRAGAGLRPGCDRRCRAGTGSAAER